MIKMTVSCRAERTHERQASGSHGKSSNFFLQNEKQFTAKVKVKVKFFFLFGSLCLVSATQKKAKSNGSSANSDTQQKASYSVTAVYQTMTTLNSPSFRTR